MIIEKNSPRPPPAATPPLATPASPPGSTALGRHRPRPRHPCRCPCLLRRHRQSSFAAGLAAAPLAAALASSAPSATLVSAALSVTLAAALVSSAIVASPFASALATAVFAAALATSALATSAVGTALASTALAAWAPARQVASGRCPPRSPAGLCRCCMPGPPSHAPPPAWRSSRRPSSAYRTCYAATSHVVGAQPGPIDLVARRAGVAAPLTCIYHRPKSSTTLPQVVLVDISYACMQASPDLAYGARVQSDHWLEENRQNN